MTTRANGGRRPKRAAKNGAAKNAESSVAATPSNGAKPHHRAPSSVRPNRRSDDGRAFLADPYDGAGAHARAADELAETLAEEFVSAATNAEEMTEDVRDRVRTEEVGGPFMQTAAAEEFAVEPDESNPPDAEREAFPTATRPHT